MHRGLWVLLPILTLVSALMLMQLPQVWQFPVMLALILALYLGLARQKLWALVQEARQAWLNYRRDHAAPVFQPLSRWQIGAEIAFLAVATLFFTQGLWRSDNTTKLPGSEMEWVTSYVQVAHQALTEYGDIPLWNPYYRNGEPLIDNAHSFILNPLSSIFGLLFDVPQGIKYNVVFYAFFAALGGWFLAYVLKLSLPARLLLGLMLLGKGNMTSMFLAGYYQLAAQQAYFGWIIAGTIVVIKTRERWAIILTGVMMALMFMAGNVWYILPMMMSVLVVAVCYSLPLRDKQAIGQAWLRLIAAAIVTLTVSAVYTLPVVTQYDHIAHHTDEIQAGWEVVEYWRVPTLYFNPNAYDAWYGLTTFLPRQNNFSHALPHFYYSAVIPSSLVLLIFVLIPPIYPLFHHPISKLDYRRLWLAGLVLGIFMTLWGMGGTPLFEWLYANIAPLRRWRFVGRALAVGSFWVALLVALRLDALWRAINGMQFAPRVLRRIALLMVFITTLAAGWQLNSLSWSHQAQVISRGIAVDENESYVARCLRQLRQAYPDAELSIWMMSYVELEPFIRYRVRLSHIGADFLAVPDPSTVGIPEMNLWERMPEYGLPLVYSQRQYLFDRGYKPEQDIRAYNNTCFLRHPMKSVPYAFALPEGIFLQYWNWEQLSRYTMPVLAYENRLDTIAVLIAKQPIEQTLIVKETAYPGWTVTVNGVPAKLDITGGLISVVLPPGVRHEMYQVVFAYRPPRLYGGAVITFIAIFLCCAYLLQVDERLKKWHQSRTRVPVPES